MTENSPARNRNSGYWAATVIAALLFVVTGAALLLQVPHFTEDMGRLGYPAYFLAILGTWKILGAIVIITPGLPRLKEWAYAGMIFDTSSAAISRVVMGDVAIKIIAPLIVAGIVLLSWKFRPEGRVLIDA